MTYVPPIMDEDLRESRLLVILDILVESDTPLTVPQIQRRLTEIRSINLSQDEIEAHLTWGLNQPNATNAPVRPIREYPITTRAHRRRRIQRPWTVVYKHPLTPDQIKAAGSPPFEVT